MNHLLYVSVHSGGGGVVTPTDVCEVVLDPADVKQRVHVVEAAPGLGVMELQRVRGFVLG